MKMNVLVTGGAGYIGTHTVIELIQAGHDVVIVDNLINSSREAVKRVEKIVGKELAFYEVDVTNKEALDTVFSKHTIDAVIHFAGLKAVGESVAKPIDYYRNNIGATLALAEVMQKHGVNNIVFSSSATVYGRPARSPITEDFPLSATNPYGQTKLMCEQILTDIAVANPDWKVTILRYFNPIGAHASGTIGESPNGTPNNILPYIAQVAVGKLPHIKVFGTDYPTPDGTGVRDYIHVVDLAKGHIAALEHSQEQKGVATYNLGSGKGTSVMELIAAFEKACGKKLEYTKEARRPGDIAECYADPSKANRELSWRAEKTVEQACQDSWRWQSANPNGFVG
ncbi:MAG TPA: UDP-glucose 4-epimerase GalE [Candidatus Saccharimonadales bacterium]|nr:UDP-glucose 4-epimerase GalE [Candidatus Saccharimonadales bacterium]